MEGEEESRVVPRLFALARRMRQGPRWDLLSQDYLPRTPEVLPPKKSGMNKKQKAILITVMVVILVMLVFPPFHVTLPTGAVQNLGYGLLFNPPERDYLYLGRRIEITGSVDIALLVTQWLGTLIVGGIAYFLCKD